MNKVVIGYALLILVSLITALIGVMKRKAILKFGEITLGKALSVKFWFTVLLNPFVIFIFVLAIAMFGVTLIIYSSMTADKVVMMSWTLQIPAFLITIFFNSILLNEKMPSGKGKYLMLLFCSVILGVIGVKGYMK